jgi:hypothetical protein
MALSCVVRGRPFEAAAAAAERGIPFTFRSHTAREVIGLVPLSHYDQVVTWFSETADVPFSVGALLFYREIV